MISSALKADVQKEVVKIADHQDSTPVFFEDQDGKTQEQSSPLGEPVPDVRRAS